MIGIAEAIFAAIGIGAVVWLVAYLIVVAIVFAGWK